MKTFLSVLFALLALILVVACGGEEPAQTKGKDMEAMPSTAGHAPQGEMAANMVVDPVCGMKIKKEDAMATASHKGQTYYFCMEGDKDTFVEDPGK
jgi:Cu+-exporting ATPase